MTRAAILILGLLAGPASAATITFEETPDGPQIGIIHYANDLESNVPDEQTVVLETSRGPVTLRLLITPNAPCGEYAECPDTLEVVEAPPGTLVQPGEITVPEMEAGEMRLMEWSGM